VGSANRVRRKGRISGAITQFSLTCQTVPVFRQSANVSASFWPASRLQLVESEGLESWFHSCEEKGRRDRLQTTKQLRLVSEPQAISHYTEFWRRRCPQGHDLCRIRIPAELLAVSRHGRTG
jgi:hypothetical protein